MSSPDLNGAMVAVNHKTFQSFAKIFESALNHFKAILYLSAIQMTIFAVTPHMIM